MHPLAEKSGLSELSAFLGLYSLTGVVNGIDGVSVLTDFVEVRQLDLHVLQSATQVSVGLFERLAHTRDFLLDDLYTYSDESYSCQKDKYESERGYFQLTGCLRLTEPFAELTDARFCELLELALFLGLLEDAESVDAEFQRRKFSR